MKYFPPRVLIGFLSVLNALFFFILLIVLVVNLLSLLNLPTGFWLGGSDYFSVRGDAYQSIPISLNLSRSDTTVYLSDPATGQSARYHSWEFDGVPSPDRLTYHIEQRRQAAAYPIRDTVLTQWLVNPSYSRLWKRPGVRYHANGTGLSYDPDSLLKNPIFSVSGFRQAQAYLVVTQASPRDRWLIALPGLLSSLLILTILYQLGALLRQFRRGLPFTPTTFRRMRIMGFAFTGFFFLPYLQNWLNTRLFGSVSLEVSSRTRILEPIQVTASPATPEGFVWLLVGLLLIVLASLFKYGHELQNEAELTI